MLRKIVEKQKKIQDLKKACFDARDNLIVTTSKRQSNDVGCIQLNYSVERVMVDPWKYGAKPEDTYRVIGPNTKYCFAFNQKDPTKRSCNQRDCPMFHKYQQYLEAYKALQKELGKTK